MTVVITDDLRVRTIAFDRPEAMNAWNAVMERAFRNAITDAAEDDGVRAIVVTGTGKAFCAGADLSGDVSRVSAGRQPVRSLEDGAQRYSYLLGIPKPIVAAINGAVAGVGLCLALYCDVRFISSRARLTTAFARRGMPAEHGIAWMLPRLIGPMNARDLLLSGRTVDAAEAAAMGLARLVDEADFHRIVREYAQSLAERCSPRSIRVIKRQLLAAMGQSLAQATATAEAEADACRDTEDLKEGIAHFIEKRAPSFSGR